MPRSARIAALLVLAAFLVPVGLAHAAPGNDDFAGAVPVALGGSATTDITTATFGPGEPAPSCWEFPAESHAVWFRFDAAAAGGVVADTAGSSFVSPDDDTVLAVFAGADLASLVEVACNDDFGPDYQAQVGWMAVPGQTYHLLAGGWDSSEVGTLRLALEAGPAITGATVVAAGGSPAGEVAVDLFDGDGYLLRRARTDATGSFALVARPGDYRVRFGGDGGYVTLWYDGAAGFAGATPLALGAGGLAGIDASLVASSVRGTVTDALTGARLPGITVSVVDGAGAVVASAVTDAAGRYVAGHLAPRAYRVGFADPAGGYLPLWHPDAASLAGAVPVEVGTGAVPVVDASLRLGSGLAGTVTAASGGPLAGIEVAVIDALGVAYPAVVTDAAGGYAVVGLPPGGYRVRFADPTLAHVGEWYDDRPDAASADVVTVAAGVVTGGVDAVLAADPGGPRGTVAGTVTDAATGAPLAGIEVRIGALLAVTDAAGGYVLAGVPAGSHVVDFSDPGGGHEPSSAPATVVAGQTTTVDVALAPVAPDPPGAVAGRVTDAVTGAPLAGIEVRIGALLAVTDAAGGYVLAGVAAGSHVVQFADPAGEYQPASSPATVVAGQTTTVDAALDPVPAEPPGAIAGTVTDAVTGAPLAGVEVRVGARVAVTDAAGDYVLGGIPPGSHAVQFTDPAGGYQPASKSATVTSGAVTTIDAALAPVANRPPVVVDDAATVRRGWFVDGPSVLGNDSDPDGDPISAVLLDGPSHGELTFQPDGTYRYWHDWRSPATSDSFTYRASDGDLSSATATVTITVQAWAGGASDPGEGPFSGLPDDAAGQVEPDVLGAVVDRGGDLGLVDPAQGLWHLRSREGATTAFYYGNPGDYPMMGDWDCDGVDTPGLYRRSDGYVYLRNSNTVGIADIRFYFGDPGDLPLAGDFDGDGCDTVSIYRPAEARTYVINELGADEGGLGAAAYAYLFGNPGDKPFVGDFDGDGVESVGLHRESTGLVYFRNSTTTGIADSEFIYGDPGDRLVAGDWNADGADSPAVFRPSDRAFFLRYENTQGVADESLPMGEAPWLPVAGWFDL